MLKLMVIAGGLSALYGVLARFGSPEGAAVIAGSAAYVSLLTLVLLREA